MVYEQIPIYLKKIYSHYDKETNKEVIKLN